MRSADKGVITFIVVGIAGAAVAFAVFSFIDPVQGSYFVREGTVLGVPVEWQFNFSYPFSSMQGELYAFHNFLLGLSIAICAFVAALIAVAIWLFRASRRPRPSLTTHNTALEVTWTLLPALVLLAIALWSFPLLQRTNILPASALSLKVTGNQWFWTYAYPDLGGIEFQSLIIEDDKLSAEQRSLRQLAVDQYVVLPINTNIRIQVTAADVVHSWGVQSLGVKKDAIPGRLNETWVRVERSGFYYGGCYELCGRRHAYMPIGIEAVSQERFDAWVAEARRRIAGGRPPPPHADIALAAWSLGKRQ
jgi:cytochrome c oxidase subunit II